MKDLLKRIAATAYWEIPVFEGALILRGRILSPSEAETNGLITSLLATQFTTPQQIQQMKDLKSVASDFENGTAKDAQVSFLLSAMRHIKPESLAAISENNDKLLCEVVTTASTDNGVTWEKIRLVSSIEQQNHEKNVLWVGVLTKEDRDKIIEKALKGHKEAAEKLCSFR